MIDISVAGVSKEFEVGKRILDGLTFQVDTGERVGLLGKNGAGKTTLFKIVTGELDCDEGQVAIATGKRVGLITQIPVYPVGYTVEQVLRAAFDRLHGMEKEMAELTGEMEHSSDPALLRRYGALSAAYEAGGGYDMETPLNKVCNGLEIPQDMRERQFSALSGGEKTRVNLARLILEDTDVLLLDEPTNHLDLRATEWLEEYLAKFKGTVLTISHDRWFLDRVVTRIVELEDGRAEFYAGNYSFYVEEKERRYEEKLKQYEKEQAKINQLQEAADKLHLWAFMGADKLHKRAFSMEKRIERMRKTDKPKKDRRLDVKFGERDFRGDEVMVIKDLKKGFGDRMLFEKVDLLVEGGERIALLGDNGTGKSTLLKMILGEEEPDDGKIRMGPTVRLGYLPQIVHFDRPDRNLVDTMIYAQNCSTQEARDRLAAFSFRGEDVFKEVSALSGGEQLRLRLCMLMDEKINLLILDEPTNHLDLGSREWIEEAVADYKGNLLFVSHDRYFINQFATRIWMLENGRITDFEGTFSEYQDFLNKKAPPAPMKEEPPKPEKPKRTGGTKNLEKEVNAAERAVSKAEERMFELTQEIEEASADYLRLTELYAERDKLEDEIASLYALWERLAAELEEAQS
ncbi:MAG: ABC transporter ATP-binding protein [Clostridia bacterium]|nr:ABC transporter ATP-binding protein [Clostridia bacterium]